MSPELRKKIASYGCNDTCIFGCVGQSTNGGCRCLGEKDGGKMTPKQRARIRAGVLFLRQELKAALEQIETLQSDYAHALATGGSSPYSTDDGD